MVCATPSAVSLVDSLAIGVTVVILAAALERFVCKGARAAECMGHHQGRP